MSDRIERKDIVNGAMLAGALVGMALIAFIGIFVLLRTDKVDDVKAAPTTIDADDGRNVPSLVAVVNGTEGRQEGIAGEGRELLTQRGFRTTTGNAKKLYANSVVVYDPDSSDDVQNVAASAAAELQISTEQVLTFERQAAIEAEEDDPDEETVAQLREALNGPQVIVILGRDFE